GLVPNIASTRLPRRYFEPMGPSREATFAVARDPTNVKRNCNQRFGGRMARPRQFEPRLSMRIAVVLLVLPLSACAGAYATPSDGRLKTRIDTAFAARDACLARNVAS